MIRDRNIDWRRKRVFYTWRSFLDSIGVTTTTYVKLGAGAAVAQEISDFEVAGLLVDTAADEVNGIFPVPWDADPDYELGFSVLWTSGSATTADTIDWVVLFELFAVGGVLDEVAGALDTAIAQDTVSGAYQLQKTARGIKNAGWATRAQTDAGAFFGIQCDMNAFAAGLDEDKFFLGLEMDYRIRATEGSSARAY